MQHSNGRKRSRPPSPKRSRVSRACDKCRASREKCDGARPCCRTCFIQKRECSYDDPAKKRGIQPNYIRSLEVFVAWLLNEYPDADGRLASHLVCETDSIRGAIVSGDAAAEKLLRVWRDSMIRRQSEQLLSGSKVDGPAPTALPDAAWLLLEYYFAFTQAWLPIVERQNILKTFYTYPTDNNHAELWSILALSAIQLKQATDGSYEDAKIRDFAQAQSRHSSGEASTNVRTTLLQVLLEMTCGEWQQAWMQIGSAIRTLLSLPSTNLQSLTLSAFVLESAIAHQLGISEVHLRPDYASAMGLLADDGVEEWAPWEDPLVATGEKPPTMALSTLNQLVRMTLRAYDSSGRLKLESDAASKAVVALLSNAVLTHGRLRPWAKLTTLEPEVALPPVLDGVEEDTSGLFEELAMLGHSDSDSHHSQFMQNLGFAPDLDLSEYFGRDYGVSRDGR